METNKDSVQIDMDDLAEMIDTSWEDFKKNNEVDFVDEETELQCKGLFIIGYHYACSDLSQLSSRLMELDELMGSDE